MSYVMIMNNIWVGCLIWVCKERKNAQVASVLLLWDLPGKELGVAICWLVAAYTQGHYKNDKHYGLKYAAIRLIFELLCCAQTSLELFMQLANQTARKPRPPAKNFLYGWRWSLRWDKELELLIKMNWLAYNRTLVVMLLRPMKVLIYFEIQLFE